MPLFVHQDLRILTYVGALLTEDLSIAPHLSEFEHNELHTYKEKVEPKVGNLFDLTF